MQRIKQYRILAWIFAIIFFIVNVLFIVVIEIAPKNEQGEITGEWSKNSVWLLFVGLISFILFLVFSISLRARRKSLRKNAVHAPVVPINPDDKLCTYCGAVISSDYKFCLNCGKKVITQEPVVSLLEGSDAQAEETKDDVSTYESDKPIGLKEYYKAFFYGCTYDYVIVICASLIIAALGIYVLVRSYMMGNLIGYIIFAIILLLIAIMLPLFVFVISPVSKMKKAKQFNSRDTIKVYEGLICIETYVYNEGSAGASRMKIFLDSVSKAKEDDKGYYFAFINDNIQQAGLFIRKEPDMSESFKASLSDFVKKAMENKKNRKNA